jgi:hypothetical protein
MGSDEPVMKSRSDFIWLICLVFNPVAAIIEKLSQVRRDTIGINADVLAGCPVLSGPAPNIAVHPLVHVLQKLLIQHITLARKRLLLRFADIGLFRLVELTPQGDIGGDQPFLFFLGKLCSGVVLRV